MDIRETSLPQPDFTPTREQIARYGLNPPPVEASYRAKKETDARIYHEACRRFEVTLESLQPLPYLIDEKPPHYQAPPPDLDPDEKDAWEAEYDRRLQKYHDTLSVKEEELHDPYVKEYLRQMVSLYLTVNKLQDRHVVEAKSFTPPPPDARLNAFHQVIKTTADQLYAQVTALYHKEEYGGTPYLDEQGEEKIEYSYESDTFIYDIDREKYDHLARVIADHCVKNSYLESLFQIFAPRSLRDQLENTLIDKMITTKPTPEKGVEIPPQIETVINHAKTHIASMYGLKVEELPAIVFTDDASQLESLVKKAQRHSLLKNSSLFDELSSSQATTRAGIYLRESREGTRTGTCYVYWDKTIDPIDNAVTAFEEIYHATGEFFKSANSSGLKWPGWNGLDDTGTLLEEALAGFETNEFFKKYYKNLYLADGTRANRMMRLAQGEEVQGVIHDFWPTVFMNHLIDRCGSQTLLLLRQARQNLPGANVALALHIDRILGQGSSHYLRGLNGHNNAYAIHSFIKEKLLPINPPQKQNLT